MAKRLSRRSLARHIVDVIARGDSLEEALSRLAAYLIDTRRTKEMTLIVRDIEDLLLEHGTVVGTVISAHELSTAAKQAIDALVKKETGASEVSLAHHTDKSVIGGYKIILPGHEIDHTITHQLTALKTRLKKV